jgi:HK97 family phage major capsid protein/HK97 family phage prohead protease
MPLPKPGKDQKQDDFISSCISTVMHSGETDDNKQATAICFQQWNDAKKEGKQAMAAKLKQMVPQDDEDEDDFMERCTDETGDEDSCQMIWDDYEGNGVGMSAKPVIRKTHSAEVSGMEFILSDATVDRYGDSVASDGWVLDNFNKNPIALFNHNPDAIVGKWENLRVKDGGLRGHLRLAPEGTSARIDEIRKLVDAGILKAVSVGFMPIEAGPRMAGGKHAGQLYMRQELVETSLVSVPANPNALAVAKSLKVSDDTLKLVFGKQAAQGPVTRASGKGGKQAEIRSFQRRNNGMNLSQRIQETEARIVKYQDELDVHMKTVDDENPTEEAMIVTKDLTTKIEKQQSSLEALKGAEAKLALSAAKANGNGANGGGSGNGSAQAMTIYNPRPFAFPAKKIQPMDHLCRAITVALKHHAEKNQRPMIDLLKETYGDNENTEMTRMVMGQMVSKAATIPADTTTLHWASELVQTVIGEFIAALMPLSIYPRLAAKGGSFTFGRNGTISLPARNTTSTIAGSFFAQGAPIPVRQGAFSAITLTPKKLGVITTLTREITEHSTPSIEGIVRQAILDDTAVAIDSILLDNNPATTTRPAGLKNGVTPFTAVTGGGIAAVIGDLKGLVGTLIAGTNGNLRAPVWIMNPADALAVSLTQAAAGGAFPFLEEIGRDTLMGYPLITSSTCPVDTMFFLDAADFITATGDSPRFDVSDQAVLHMEDTTPLQISSTGTPPTVAAPARSLWQTDTIGIRMIMDLNWAVRRTGVVAYTTAMTWN